MIDGLKHIAPSTGFTVLDVGARGGMAGKLRPLAGLIDVVGFEPDVEECEVLNQQVAREGAMPWRSVRYVPMALGRDEENRPFFITRSPDLSSLLRPNMALHGTLPHPGRVEVVREVSVNTRSLDGLAGEAESPVAGAAFIKVDTQGSELEILQSGQQLLRTSVVGIEVEVEFVELYEGQALFSDVDQYLRSQGFDLYWFDRYYMATEGTGALRQVSHANALYLASPFRAGHTSTAAWRAWLAIAACYGLGEACSQTLAILEKRGLHLDGSSGLLRSACERLARPVPWSWRRRVSLLRSVLAACFRPTPAQRRHIAYKALKEVNSAGISWRAATPGL